jgi:hypothetical protein
MLHEKPILVAFAVSQRPLNAKLGHRTISPASASTSSSSDSAIGTTSPSSTVSISPTGTHEQQHIVNVAFAIQPENSSYKPHIHEITMSGDFEADITEVSILSFCNFNIPTLDYTTNWRPSFVNFHNRRC